MKTKRKAVVGFRVSKTPPKPLKGVRRSTRKSLPPKRFPYSPEPARVKTKKRKRRRTTTTRRNDRRDVGDSDEKVGHGRYSPYELQRLENVRQNQAFLSSINLLQATEELKQLTQRKPSQRGLVRSKAAVNEALPARKSLRLQDIEP